VSRVIFDYKQSIADEGTHGLKLLAG